MNQGSIKSATHNELDWISSYQVEDEYANKTSQLMAVQTESVSAPDDIVAPFRLSVTSGPPTQQRTIPFRAARRKEPTTSNFVIR